jgi:hypothetical protein
VTMGWERSRREGDGRRAIGTRYLVVTVARAGMLPRFWGARSSALLLIRDSRFEPRARPSWIMIGSELTVDPTRPPRRARLGRIKNRLTTNDYRGKPWNVEVSLP